MQDPPDPPDGSSSRCAISKRGPPPEARIPRSTVRAPRTTRKASSPSSTSPARRHGPHPREQRLVREHGTVSDRRGRPSTWSGPRQRRPPPVRTAGTDPVSPTCCRPGYDPVVGRAGRRDDRRDVLDLEREGARTLHPDAHVLGRSSPAIPLTDQRVVVLDLHAQAGEEAVAQASRRPVDRVGNRAGGRLAGRRPAARPR